MIVSFVYKTRNGWKRNYNIAPHHVARTEKKLACCTRVICDGKTEVNGPRRCFYVHFNYKI